MYFKQNKKSLLMLAISLVVILVTSFLGSLIQTKGYSIKITDLRDEKNTGMLIDEATGQPTNIKVSGTVASGLLYMPKDASETNKLPAVVLTHGYLNNRELQMPFAVELARRGFIVLAIDREGHGNHENTGSTGAMMATKGMYDSVKYLYNLPEVDKSKIGISGHSMGGYTTAMTLLQDSVTYGGFVDKSMKLDSYGLPVRDDKGEIVYKTLAEKQAEGQYLGIISAGLMQGWSQFIFADANVDVGMLKAKDDEFFYTSKDVDGNPTICRQFLQSQGAASFVGDTSWKTTGVIDIENGGYYVGGQKVDTPANGAAIDSPFRVIYEADEIHPLNHWSVPSTASLVEFFYTSFGTPNGHKYIKPSNQVWTLKEATATIGLAAVIFMIFPLISLLLTIPFFAELKKRRLETEDGRIVYEDVVPEVEAAGTVELKGLQAHLVYWIPAVVCFFVIAFNVDKISDWAGSVFPNSPLYPQDTTNWVSVWSAACGLIAIAIILLANVVTRVVNKIRHTEELNTNPFEVARIGSVSRLLKTLLLAAIVVSAMFTVLWVNWDIFTTDFRLWTLQMKVFNVELMLPTMLRYLPIFGVYYVCNAIANQTYRVKNLPEWASVAINAAFTAGAILLPILIQYITFKSTGVLWQPGMNLSYIVLFPIVAVLVIAVIISRYTYKKTGSIWLGAFINSILWTVITVAGTAASYAYIVAA